jgi:DNA-directed RNA polymerase subunit RPC12/RpoP
MTANFDLGILAEPLQPPLSGRCAKCRRLFALKFVKEEPSKISGTISTYRCKHCGHEQVFAERHPPGAL